MPLSDQEQKRAALRWINEAWSEARHDGIDDDCMALTCLFAAFAHLVTTYGEDATAVYAESLVKRIRNGDFSVNLPRQ